MGLSSWLKSKFTPEPLDTKFTAEEAELAPQIAETAGSVMSLQLSTASRYAMVHGHDLKEFMWQIQAFAFGLLCSALEQKGIPWYKGASVLTRYCETYMPDYPDHKELAQLVSHFGTNPEYERYVVSGRAAMVRFANNQIDEPTGADINDLAVALGLDRDSET
ncbi:MAG: hypothetical protein R3E72_13070 [Steroidobacteraceae bacterium]